MTTQEGGRMTPTHTPHTTLPRPWWLAGTVLFGVGARVQSTVGDTTEVVASFAFAEDARYACEAVNGWDALLAERDQLKAALRDVLPLIRAEADSRRMAGPEELSDDQRADPYWTEMEQAEEKLTRLLKDGER